MPLKGRKFSRKTFVCQWPGCGQVVTVGRLVQGRKHFCQKHRWQYHERLRRQRQFQAVCDQLDQVCLSQIEPLFQYAQE